MFKKIITYFIILAVVLPIFATAVPLGGGVKQAYASELDRKKQIVSPCGWTAGIFSGSFPECVLFTGTYLLYELGVNGSVWITGLASDLFNVSIQFSLTGASFDANKNVMIKDGWVMVRDLLNLVFIFILLYAAISTILQYGNVDIKKILPGLIVAALLVNFSLMISKVVIDASHIFSWEFYNQIDSTKGGTFKETKGSAEIAGDFVKKDLAGVFLAGFNPQRLLIGTPISKEGVVVGDFTEKQSGDGAETVSAWKSLQSAASIKGESFLDTLWRIIIILASEIGLAVFASFILFAGAIMFIIRVVILWILMIFSPIAFLGMILPKMGEYSKMWWKNLIDQAFFAPAFLFMFMLATKFINADLIDSLLHITPNDTSSVVTGLKMGEVLSIIFNFVIVATLLSACLIVAKKMGGKSAELGMAWAHKGKDKLLSPGWMLNNRLSNNRLSRYLYGAGADKILEGKGRVSGILKAIPGASIGLRKLGGMKKADEDKARKAAEKYAGTLSKAGLTSLKRDTEDKGFIKRFMYTGPEGAFAPGKEGYQNIIAKKKSEDDEKIKYRKKLAELANYSDDKDSNGNIIKGRSKEDKVKYKLNAGQRKEIDEEIEKATKKIADAYKKAAEVIEDRITTTAVDLTEKNARLYKAIEDGSPVDVLKKEITKLEKDRNKYNGQKAIMEKKKKEREDKVRVVEKFEAKQETEKLGAKFSSAGGGGSAGGGTKKP